MTPIFFSRRSGWWHPTLISTFAAITVFAVANADEPIRLRVDFSRPDGTWNMPALALGQGGLQSDPMIEPHIKELRQFRPRTIRLFLSEYYRIYPDHGRYDWSRLDRELRAVRAVGARPTLSLAMKPPVLYPTVDHFTVHPNDYDEWERLCEALARHCREEGFDVAAWEVCNEPDIGEMGGTPHYFRKRGGLQPILHAHGNGSAAGRSRGTGGRTRGRLGRQFPGRRAHRTLRHAKRAAPLAFLASLFRLARERTRPTSQSNARGWRSTLSSRTSSCSSPNGTWT